MSSDRYPLYRINQSKTTKSASTVIKSSDITLHGNSPRLKKNKYAKSSYVISELGIGQKPEKNEKAKHNYSSFTVNAPSGGTYNFAIRYSNDEPAPIMQKADGSTYIHPYNIDLVERYAQFIVNGGEAGIPLKPLMFSLNLKREITQSEFTTIIPISFPILLIQPHPRLII